MREVCLMHWYLPDKFRLMMFPQWMVGILSLILTASVIAQDAGAGKNLIRNPGFESGVRRDNLWTGVTKEGYLSGFTYSIPVLTAGGNIGNTPMPISVAVADMNADGLNDIVAADPMGYIRIYFNKGTKEEPKFTIGELVGVFLSWSPEMAGLVFKAQWSRSLRIPRISLAEVNGRQALYIGNYRGDILRLQNDGSIQVPDFRQPQSLEKITIPTMKDGKRRWGNVFAPAVFDWNRDGKTDLLLGEGSYSANNIHLLINQGTSLTPRFDETNRSAVAYGDGKEQLSPTVVDYNGDGQPDILMGDRSGQISLFINTGAQWKPGVELPFKGYLRSGAGTVEEVEKEVGSPLRFGGICTVAAGDFSGNGVFDLVVGKANGRIAFVKNTGTPGKPKWAAPVELKAESPGPVNILPSGWDIDTGSSRGNFYGVVGTENEESIPKLAPPEGKVSLRLGYDNPLNEIMKNPSVIIPGLPKFDPTKNPSSLPEAFRGYSPSNVIIVSQTIQKITVGTKRSNRPFQADKTYTLSFKVKGSGSTGAQAILWAHAWAERENRVVKVTTSRGGVQVQRNYEEYRGVSVPFTPSSSWTEVTKDIKITYKESELNKADTIHHAIFYFYVPLVNGTGEVFIDDVHLIAK